MKTTIQDIFREIQPEGSFSMARRLVSTAGVKFNGTQVMSMTDEVEVEDGSFFHIGKRNLWLRQNDKWIMLVSLIPGVEYGMSLRDPMDGPADLDLRAINTGQSLLIGADGYGEKTSENGYGFPIAVEFYEGKFRVLIWSDINKEDPTHVISLEGAREDAREAE